MHSSQGPKTRLALPRGSVSSPDTPSITVTLFRDQTLSIHLSLGSDYQGEEQGKKGLPYLGVGGEHKVAFLPIPRHHTWRGPLSDCPFLGCTGTRSQGDTQTPHPIHTHPSLTWALRCRAHGQTHTQTQAAHTLRSQEYRKPRQPGHC